MFRTASVAMDNAKAPKTQYIKPNSLMPVFSLNPIIRVTPKKPIPSPATPIIDNRCPKNSHPSKATNSGILEAMIAAKDASIHCIATKLRPR